MPNAFHLLNAEQMQLYHHHQSSLNSPSTPTQLTANHPTGSASATAAALAATLGNLGHLGPLSSLLPMTGFSSLNGSNGANAFNLASFAAGNASSPLAMTSSSAPLSPEQAVLTGSDSKQSLLQSLTAGLAGQLNALSASQPFSISATNTLTTTSSSHQTSAISQTVNTYNTSHDKTINQNGGEQISPKSSDERTIANCSSPKVNSENNTPLNNGRCLTSSPVTSSCNSITGPNAADFRASILAAAATAVSSSSSINAPSLNFLNELLAFYDMRKMYENLPYVNALYPALLANSSAQRNQTNTAFTKQVLHGKYT